MGQRPPENPPPSAHAFDEIVQRHQQALGHFLYRFTGQVEQAHDLVQETFLDAWRVAQLGHAPFATSDDEGIRRWLFHAAYCKAISVLRRRRVIRWEPLTPVLEDQISAATNATLSFEDRIAEVEILRAALAQLAQPDIACLLLRVVEGFSYTEIGHIIEASPEAVMKRLARAKQRLRAAYLAHLQPVQE
ncbi:MAG: sigma-70 family RNA polymerase sigma factor [Ktedonobacterales bacterium]|nr:sigma-70 family RNA polymerase sigma factor [Ktedonobacterales bacterium]